MLFPLAYSQDEFGVLIASLVVWGMTWFLGARQLAAGPRLGTARAPSRIVGCAVLAATALVFLVLRTSASWDVRDSFEYLTQYLALGAAWIGLGPLAFTRLGLSVRDDAVERGNLAAAVALAGAFLGLALCYAGGNVGDGPGWQVVLFASSLATAGFFATWGRLERLARPAEAIGIDRDLAAGVRHGAFCLALGAILGRAAAGDWVSPGATLLDFATNGWTVLVLLALGVVFERTLRPTAEVPRRSVLLAGLLPAFVYLGGAWAWIASRGSWE